MTSWYQRSGIVSVYKYLYRPISIMTTYCPKVSTFWLKKNTAPALNEMLQRLLASFFSGSAQAYLYMSDCQCLYYVQCQLVAFLVLTCWMTPHIHVVSWQLTTLRAAIALWVLTVFRFAAGSVVKTYEITIWLGEWPSIHRRADLGYLGYQGFVPKPNVYVFLIL